MASHRKITALRASLEWLEQRQLLAVDTFDALVVTPLEYVASRSEFERAIPFGTPAAEDSSWPFNVDAVYDQVTLRAMLEAGTASGANADSPTARIDPNSSTSIYRGVGSIEIKIFGTSIICTGTVIGTTHVLTAGHCFDLNSDGRVDSGILANATFHLNDGGSPSSDLKISNVTLHPDFGGFSTSGAFDDMAVLTLSTPVPTGTVIYPIVHSAIQVGQVIDLVGYGGSGHGDRSGTELIAETSVKRIGKNTVDLFVADDEGKGTLEVFLYDFDGPVGAGLLGGPTLGNRVETVVRNGDSGGPAFISVDNRLVVAGVSTFEFSVLGVTAQSGLFGTVGGGSVIGPFEAAWIDSILGGGEIVTPPTPEPPDTIVSFLSNGGSMPESKPRGKLSVTRTGDASQPLTVNYAVIGTATPDEDYVRLPGTLVIPAGSKSASLIVEAIDDLIFEGDETLGISLLPTIAYRVGSHPQHVITLVDDDIRPEGFPMVSFDASVVLVDESDGTFAVNVRRDHVTDQSLTVYYQVSGSASAGSDFQPLTGRATIPAGSASVPIDIAILDDDLDELDETLILSLLHEENYELGSASDSTITIRDNDLPVVRIETDRSAIEEGQDLIWTITRDGILDQPLVVPFTFQGTATAGTDFTLPLASVTIPAGLASTTVVVRTINDAVDEHDETVDVQLGLSENYRVSDSAVASFVILDDDLPIVTIGAPEGIELAENATGGKWTVVRNGLTDGPLTVSYSVLGTAKAGQDYQTLPGVVTISAGSNSAAIDLKLIDDNIDEDNETIVVVLSATKDYALGASVSGVASIIDNDEAPAPTAEVTFLSTSGSMSESKASGKLSLIRTGDLSKPLTVNYQVTGSATSGIDFRALPGSTTFEAGKNSARINIEPLNDNSDEPNETVAIRLLPNAGYLVGQIPQHVITLLDDDDSAPPPTNDKIVFLDVLDAASVTEGNPGQNKVATFQVRLRDNQTFFQPIYVYLSTGNESATGGSDFEIWSQRRFTIPANTNSIQVSVPIIEDLKKESNETFSLTISAAAATEGVAPNSVKLGDATGRGTILNDD